MHPRRGFHSVTMVGCCCCPAAPSACTRPIVGVGATVHLRFHTNVLLSSLNGTPRCSSRASKERSARRAVMGTRVPVRPSTHQHSHPATSRVTRGTVAPCCATPTVSALGHHSAAVRIAEARRVSACMTRAPRQGTTKVLTSSNARSTRRASR